MNPEALDLKTLCLLLTPPSAPSPSFPLLVQDSAVNKHDSNCNPPVFFFSSLSAQKLLLELTSIYLRTEAFCAVSKLLHDKKGRQEDFISYSALTVTPPN